MKKQFVKTALIAIASIGILAGSASADLLTGSVAFSTPIGDSWLPTGGTGISDATGIDFIDGLLLTPDGFEGQVTSASGDLLAMLTGTPDVNFNDFTFSPLAPPVTVWSQPGTGFSFDLFTVSVVLQTDTQLNLEGTGWIYSGSFDPTPATFTYTGNGTDDVFSWSAGNTAVPEPTTMLLFGTGLAGLAGIARRKKSVK